MHGHVVDISKGNVTVTENFDSDSFQLFCKVCLEGQKHPISSFLGLDQNLKNVITVFCQNHLHEMKPLSQNPRRLKAIAELKVLCNYDGLNLDARFSTLWGNNRLAAFYDLDGVDYQIGLYNEAAHISRGLNDHKTADFITHKLNNLKDNREALNQKLSNMTVEQLKDLYDTADKKNKVVPIDLYKQLPNIDPVVWKQLGEVQTNMLEMSGMLPPPTATYYDNSMKQGKKVDLTGKNFVFTGTLAKYVRNEAAKKVMDLGGNWQETLRANTDYLIYGQAPGSKLTEAQKKGIRCLNEIEFEFLLAGKKVPDNSKWIAGGSIGLVSIPSAQPKSKVKKEVTGRRFKFDEFE